MHNDKIARIDALLPQTQCRECGYPSCKAYAEAICLQGESIGLCAPGGEVTLDKIAASLNQDPSPDKDQVIKRYRAPMMAAIIENECIGCTKCIAACPVDAIIGAAKYMHTILTAECTGCGLCVEPCPVDCITLSAISQASYDPKLALNRFNARQQRLLTPDNPDNSQTIEHQQDKQAFIQAALARHASRRNQRE